MKKESHDHLYYRLRYGKNKRVVYACKLCTHHLSPEFMIGKLVTCSDCLLRFELKNKKDLTKQLHCRACRKRQELEYGDVLEVLRKIEKEMEGETKGLVEKEEK